MIRGCGSGTVREIMEKLFLYRYYSLKPEDLKRIVADVDAFVADAPQFDDMTMVMVEVG